MDPERFAVRFPRLYHMAQDGSWPMIQQHGLLSTSALLDLFEVQGERRDAIESQWRPESMTIAHPEIGRAVVRDQLPLRPDLLARCLTDGMSPAEWYRTLNRHVFFWVDEPHLNTLVGARAYRHQPQTILTLDTARLLDRHLPDVRLSSINSGSILRGGALRGPSTFREMGSFEGSRVVELCVLGSVPDVLGVVLEVHRREPEGSTTTLLSLRDE